MKRNLFKGLDFLNQIVVVLTIYILGALVIETFFDLPSKTKKLMYYIDYAICIFFIIEFLIRFYSAKDKVKFLRWGWIDLIASIPIFKVLRLGRIFRLVHLYKRELKNVEHQEYIQTHYGNRAKSSLEIATLIAIALIIFSSIAILQVETAPNSNIKTAGDAIWWAFVTISTVGYGDKYPVTPAGRMIAVFLMTAGVGVFGLFTAYIASIFVADEKRKEKINLEKSTDTPKEQASQSKQTQE